MSDSPADDQPMEKPEKSASAFRTISEVAQELDLPQHVLRFWETKFPQVKPMKRGGGRRYYRPDDMQLLQRIRDLLYVDGYTIKGVQKLLRQSGSVRNFVTETETNTRPEEGTVAAAAQDSPSPEKTATAARVEIDADLRQEIQDIIADLDGLRTQLLESAS